MNQADKRREYFRKYEKTRSWPRCKVCKTIARRLRDVGCLECYAKAQPPRDWTDAEGEVLEDCVGRYDRPHLQLKLYRETGIPRSRGSIQSQMFRLGLKTLNHYDGYTLGQLSKLTGKDEDALRFRIKQQGLKNIARGRMTRLSMEDGQKILDYYKKDPRPSYSMDEVKTILGCHAQTIYKAFTYGLPSWTEGYNRRVCKATIDRAAAYLRETGHVRVRWRRLLAEPVAR